MRQLYHLPLSPFSRTIRLSLNEKKLQFESIVERTWEERDDFMRLNPAGNVPVFIDMNGTVVVEHYAITEYLEEVYPDRSLLGRTVEERAEVRRLSGWFNVKFHQEVSDKILGEKVLKRYGRYQPSEASVIREGLQNIHQHLDYISWLIEHRNWLAGQEFSLADITAAAHLSCLDYLGDVPWQKYSIAKDWYSRIKSRKSFRALLDDKVPTHAPVEHYALLDF